MRLRNAIITGALLLSITMAGNLRAAEPARTALNSLGMNRGFCVYVGVTDGKVLESLARDNELLIHGLALDTKHCEQARQHLQEKKLYGRVTVETLGTKRMPYVDNLVSLLIVKDISDCISKGIPIAEIVRAISPAGAAMVMGMSPAAAKSKLTAAGVKDTQTASGPAGWTRITKSVPAGCDEWRQWQHDAARSQTSADTIVYNPAHLRWIDGPRRSRNHKDHPYAVVSASGRNFIAYDAAASRAVPMALLQRPQSPYEPSWIRRRDARTSLSRSS